ncbi:cellulose biosynthesis protein BcsN [Rhizobium sp. TRM95796]|uniref:cellulose biosynthesis protein BcsN n=1 Tax=Rhizobium sp. TRM95796 TaxID=2979862 RepID=UPI0021E8AB89|nr:cellulose biosynthesis protein BcsN [Rhizobium sp. TRM95796]MCV3767064.1 cellulose biosynthesis protein BcsN [Rhizobium sp. TRM95796]
MMARFHHAALVAALATLTGCSTSGPDPYLTTQAVSAKPQSSVSTVAPQFAAAQLPQLAGPALLVRQSLDGDRFRQEIVYANRTALSGENLLTVMAGPPKEKSLLQPPSTADVRREMRAMLPASVSARMGATLGANINGRYGYATASLPGGGACLYAWQRIKSVNASDKTGFAGLTDDRIAAQIRLRYCDPALNEAQIRLLMDGLTMRPISGATIDMLRYAAGSGVNAAIAPQPAIIAPVAAAEPVAVSKPRSRKMKVEAQTSDDWRQDADAAAVTIPSDEQPGPVTQAAALVPLPEEGASATVKPTQASETAPAVTVPLPE